MELQTAQSGPARSRISRPQVVICYTDLHVAVRSAERKLLNRYCCILSRRHIGPQVSLVRTAALLELNRLIA